MESRRKTDPIYNLIRVPNSCSKTNFFLALPASRNQLNDYFLGF